MPLYYTGTGRVWINGTQAGTYNDQFWGYPTIGGTGYTVGTGAVANANVWQVWATSTTGTYLQWQSLNDMASQVSERDRLIQRNRNRARLLRGHVTQRAALRAAEELLASMMTPEQAEEYERLKRFHVVGKDGKLYRIRRGWAGNIDVIEDGEPVERWCVHPRAYVPEPDNMLAQKLMIESGRAGELRQIANVTALRRTA